MLKKLLLQLSNPCLSIAVKIKMYANKIQNFGSFLFANDISNYTQKSRQFFINFYFLFPAYDKSPENM